MEVDQEKNLKMVDDFKEEDEEAADDNVYAKFGVAFWVGDKPSPTFTDVYNRFIENGYIGTLTEAEAISQYKLNTGMPLEIVTEWPEIEAVTAERERCRKEFSLSDSQAEDYFRHFLPYEPMLKYSYQGKEKMREGRLYKELGLGSRIEWVEDGENADWTEEYNAFVRNGCVGLIDYDKAVELYKFYSGAPDFVTEWPELDEIKKAREGLYAKAKGLIPETELEEIIRTVYPYEPVIKFCY